MLRRTLVASGLSPLLAKSLGRSGVHGSTVKCGQGPINDPTMIHAGIADIAKEIHSKFGEWNHLFVRSSVGSGKTTFAMLLRQASPSSVWYIPTWDLGGSFLKKLQRAENGKMHASAALTFGALTDANARHRVGVYATTTALNDPLNCQREQGGSLNDAPLQFVVSSTMELYDLLLHELRDGWACRYSNNDNHHLNNNLRPAASSSCAVLPRLALDFVAAGALAAIERQEQQQLRTDLDVFYERLDDLEQYVAEELRALLEGAACLLADSFACSSLCLLGTTRFTFE